MPHAEIGIQNDPIHAIVATAQQVLIETAQPICHRWAHYKHRASNSTAPRGPLFRSPVCEKAYPVTTYAKRPFSALRANNEEGHLQAKLYPEGGSIQSKANSIRLEYA